MKKRPEDISIFDPMKAPSAWPVTAALGTVIVLNIGWAVSVWDAASLGFIVLAAISAALLLTALRAHRRMSDEVANYNEDSRVRRAEVVVQYRWFIESQGESVARTVLMDSLSGDVGTFRDIVGDRENS